jgi:hypothetical protein
MGGERSENLTGVWHGQFSYPVALPAGAFTATLLELGAHLSGSIHEPADGFDDAPDGLLFALVDGRRSGSRVSFVKTYDGSGGRTHAVRYDGVLSPDGTEIEGRWTIPGVWAGAFLMIRSAGREEAVEKKEAETARS